MSEESNLNNDLPEGHKAGFVNIVGSPNVGKSTLMNKLVGERLSIINSKAQTTRHRIMGMVNEPGYQIVYSDTPGVLDPAYKLQEGMMKFVKTALQDADVLLLVTDIFENCIAHAATLEKIANMDVPVIVLINKIDLGDQDKAVERMKYWKEQIPRAQIAAISALHNFNVDCILEMIVSDREKILTHFKQEIPYSCEVVVEDYKDEPDICKIRAEIRVARDSQKQIVIGAQGRMIKRVGTDSRKDMETFLGKKVYLDLYVRVDKDWRDDEKKLKRFGYFD